MIQLYVEQRLFISKISQQQRQKTIYLLNYVTDHKITLPRGLSYRYLAIGVYRSLTTKLILQLSILYLSIFTGNIITFYKTFLYLMVLLEKIYVS